jgi:hypothetical protein
MFFRQIVSKVTRPMRLAASVRRMGGGHDHGHGHEEKAYFLGLKPDSPSEGFEVIYGVTMFACILVLVGGSMMKTDDSFHTWARREAIAREKIIDAGGEIEPPILSEE